MQTAAAYVRVSTDSQMEYSPDSQIKLIQEYCEKNNIILLEDCIFIEESGISGKSMDKRPEFMRMIALSKKKPKPFDVILVWKFSRFTRNQQESIVLKTMLKKNGVDVISISEPLPEGPFGSLVETIISWQDQYYLTNLSQEVRRGMKEKVARGEPVTPPPLGYSMLNGEYVQNSDAELIRNIFTDYLNGIGLRALAVKYTTLGLRSKRGNPLDNRLIEYILRNPVYIGKIRWSTEGRAVSTRHYDSPNIIVSDGKHEPIVSTEVFDAVQERLNEQKKMYGKYQRAEQPAEYMLKGLVRCNTCNATLILINTKSPSLQCHKYAKGQCFVSHNIKVETANEIVIEYIRTAITTESFNFSEKSKKLEATPDLDYEKLIANETAKLARIREAYEKGIDTIEEYSYNKSRIQQSIRKLQAEMKKANTAAPTVADRKAFRNRLRSVLEVITDPAQSEENKNTALRTVIDHITFHRPGNHFEVYFYI